MEIVDHLFFSLESARHNIFGFDYTDEITGKITKIQGSKYRIKQAEKYYEDVSKIYFNLTISVDELILASKFLQIFDPEFFKIHDISKSTYMTYHIKFWHIKTVTLYDVLLKLIGVIIGFNINPQFINDQILEKSEPFSSQEALVRKFKKFKKIIDKAIRNRIIHHEEYNNLLITDLAFNELLLHFNVEPEIEFDKLDAGIKSDIIETYKENTSKLLFELNDLIQDLSLIFDKTLEELR